MVLSRLNCLSVSGAELEGLKEEILSLCREYDENREQLEKDVVVVTKVLNEMNDELHFVPGGNCFPDRKRIDGSMTIWRKQMKNKDSI